MGLTECHIKETSIQKQCDLILGNRVLGIIRAGKMTGEKSSDRECEIYQHPEGEQNQVREGRGREISICPEVPAQMAQWEQQGCWACGLVEVKWAAAILPCLPGPQELCMLHAAG